ncbi:MAG: HD domain-containing protein [Patescibacteria group bacterium]
MLVTDKIYGQFEINDPVVEELINAPSFQRLKGVWQNGLPPRYIAASIKKWTFTRYEHSIGVYLLLKILNASMEEQIAGLLHDVSHMAFSHAYDWIMEDYKKSDAHVHAQDDRHEEYVKSSELYGILKRNNLKAEKIIMHTKYQLLDTDVPNLCADRIDYFLREQSQKLAKEYARNLKVMYNKIVFEDCEHALDFAKRFIHSNRVNWASYESASRFHILARMMRYAMKKGFVAPTDFAKTDDFVLGKIEMLDDEYIQKNLKILSMPHLPKKGNKITAWTKFRYVDPLFLDNGKLKRVSAVNKEFSKHIEEERKVFTAPIEIYDG